MQKLKVKFAILTSMFISLTSFATPLCAKKELVFHCKTKAHKSINICKQGDVFIYTFGNSNKVEKRLKRHTNEVVKQPWNGVGSDINQSIGFKSGSYTYSVFSNYNRGHDEQQAKPIDEAKLADVDIVVRASGGVLVEKNNRLVATIKCRKNTMVDNIIDNVEDVITK